MSVGIVPGAGGLDLCGGAGREQLAARKRAMRSFCGIVSFTLGNAFLDQQFDVVRHHACGSSSLITLQFGRNIVSPRK
jgi:hypothetical protein